LEKKVSDLVDTAKLIELKDEINGKIEKDFQNKYLINKE